MGQLNQMGARIRHGRSAGIGDQRNALAAPQALDDGGCLAGVAVLVETECSGGDAESLKQVAGVARVLGSNHCHFAQHAQGAR